MLSKKIEALKSLMPNGDERRLLEGIYLFNGALKYFRSNAEYDLRGPITSEIKVAQVENMISSIDELLALAESKKEMSYRTKRDSHEGMIARPSLQKMIVDYVVANDFSDKAFREVAKAIESMRKSGGVERAMTSKKPYFDKLRSEYFVLDLRLSKIGRR